MYMFALSSKTTACLMYKYLCAQTVQCHSLACYKKRFGRALVGTFNISHHFQERRQVWRWTINGPIPEVEQSDLIGRAVVLCGGNRIETR